MNRDADRIAKRVDDAAFAALELIGQDLLGAAQRDAPVEEGTLRGSGDVAVDRFPGGGALLTVTFNTVYAAKQEMEDDYVHPRGGKSHYLGDQVKARVPAYRAVLQRAVDAASRSL
jgi:hypothetical protein